MSDLTPPTSDGSCDHPEEEEEDIFELSTELVFDEGGDGSDASEHGERSDADELGDGTDDVESGDDKEEEDKLKELPGMCGYMYATNSCNWVSVFIAEMSPHGLGDSLDDFNIVPVYGTTPPRSGRYTHTHTHTHTHTPHIDHFMLGHGFTYKSCDTIGVLRRAKRSQIYRASSCNTWVSQQNAFELCFIALVL